VAFDPGGADPLAAALVLGVVYGLTFCTLTCSPFIAAYVVGADRGTRRAVWLSVVFNAGRVGTYGALGLAVGVVGAAFLEEAAFARWGALAFGAVVVGIGGYLAVRSRPRACACPREAGLVSRIAARLRPGEGASREGYAALMGLLIGLVPCPPLIALLLYSAAYGSAAMGLGLGLAFGVGTMLSPMLVVAAAAGWFTDRIARDAPFARFGMSRVAGVVLIALGLWTVWRASVAPAVPL
jgi:sulfite exporter TauE/SafE